MSDIDWIKQREGWMCSVDFDYEVGEALGGSMVYPSEENLRQIRSCINADEFCRAKRVYVIDADLADALFRPITEQQDRARTAIKAALDISPL